MSKPLSERCGKPYPHNAIYEILTYGVPAGDRNEPKRYNKRTVNAYWKMLESAPPKTRQAYTLVFANGNTLKEAAQIMKSSSTTVRNYLKLIYYTRDKHGYMVSNLEKISNSSYAGNCSNISRLHEQVDRYVHHFMPLTSLTSSQAFDVLTADADGISPEHIAGFYKLNADDVQKIISDFHERCLFM